MPRNDQSTPFVGEPKQKLFAVLPSEGVKAAHAALVSAEVNASDIYIWRGAQDAARFYENQHSMWATAVKGLQSLSGESAQLERYAESLRSDQAVFEVDVSDRAAAQNAATQLKDRGGTFVHYYGSWSWETL